MPDKNPLVSIIIPCYNAAAFLQPCLNSVAFQTYKNKELIIVDDCSTDDSLAISKKFAQKYSWVKAIKNQQNQGVAESFNAGIHAAKGKYLARMDADDIMFPDRIRKQLRYLQQHPNTVIVGGQCELIDDKGEVIGQKRFPTESKDIKKMLFTSVPLQQPTIMINKTLVPESELISKKRFSPAEDYDLFFNLARFGRFANLASFTLKYREHTANISLTHPKYTFWRIQDARLYAIKHYGYRPTFMSAITAIFQTLAILLFPERLIYPLHKLTRKMTK